MSPSMEEQIYTFVNGVYWSTVPILPRLAGYGDKKIEMHQVDEIYKDLAHIVGNQQDQVNTIETQMEESRNNAESGLTQVQQANERYSSSECTIS